MAKSHKLLSKMIDFLGLDWFVLLWGKQPFEDGPSLYPTNPEEIEQRFGDLKGNKLDDALEFSQELVERERDRLQTIEAKAFAVIGIASGATGFLGWFISLVFERNNSVSNWDLMAIVFLYLFIIVCVMSLIWTIYLATCVVKPFGYQFKSPFASDIFELKEKPVEYVRKQRAVSLFYSFVRNQIEVNKKVTYLNGAFTWLRNSIVLLLIIIVFIAFYLPVKWGMSPVAKNPTPTLAVTSIVTPTYTLSPSPTVTIPIITLTSTPTKTPNPIPTSTQTPTIAPTIVVTPTQTLNP